MGRLFWKFFFFLVLAHLTAVIGVGLSIWLHALNAGIDVAKVRGIEFRPPAKSVVDAAKSTLIYGGVDALKNLITSWSTRDMPQVYAVDDKGHDIIGRDVDVPTLREARKVIENPIGQQYVKSVEVVGGGHYVLYVPDNRRRPDSVFDDPPPPPDEDPSLFNSHEPPPEMMQAPPRDLPPAVSDLLSRPAFSLSEHRQQHRSMFPVKPFLAGVFASLIFALILAWYFSKPIKSLKMAFEQAAEGNLDVRVGNKMGGRSDELTDLGRDFDAMADRLSAVIKGQTRLLHQVSHELRSPLARMQMAMGLARQNADKIPSSLDRIEREANRMDKLVGELLELSRLESGAVKIKKDIVDVTEMLDSVLDDAQYEAEEKHIKIETSVQQQYMVIGEHELLHRAIENIIRNAIKYSLDGGVIQVLIAQSQLPRHMKISILDHGVGVEESELKTIFEPFFRGARTLQSEGHGIGLAIAKQIIESHEGKIVATNRAEGGLAVEITLPFVSVST